MGFINVIASIVFTCLMFILLWVLFDLVREPGIGRWIGGINLTVWILMISYLLWTTM